jgi:threonine dehydratase
VRAMRQLWEILKIIVEPSGAVPFAALLDERLQLKGKRIGLILTGGNLDLEQLPWSAPPAPRASD